MGEVSPGQGSGDARRGDAADALRARLSGGRPVLLDGANGTELERRGHAAGLPLWSTHALLSAPEAVLEIHADYARAGADVITANTFRTQRRVLARSDRTRGDAHADLRLTRLAVELAREGAARASRTVFVAGSAPPLEDCYEPGRVPGDEALRREHGRHADNLAEAGVDLVLVETMNTIREAVVAAHAARTAGLEVVVAFVCWQGPTLLSGEPLDEAIAGVVGASPLAVALNCLPPSAIAPCWPALSSCGLPFGVYPNLGEPTREAGLARTEECSPAAFADSMMRWVDRGARLVGGCCGTTPEHIAALARRLGGSKVERDPARAPTSSGDRSDR